MTVISNSYDIKTVQWVARRGALRMEKVGLKSRGGALRPKLATELGLKPRDSYDKYITVITSLIEKRNAERPDGPI